MNMLDDIKDSLIVSCQALKDEPLHSSYIMGRMAVAAKEGGAAGIRAQGVADIIEIKKICSLPVIGIIKCLYKDSDIYITPTKKEVLELLATGCEMIALDATNRERPNNEKIEDLVKLIHQNNKLVMADISTYEEAMFAKEIGFDCISTTLCGYTPYSTKLEEPNFSLIKQLVETLDIPVIAEGKISSPKDLKQVFKLQVHAAVVGGAITRPQQITARFVSILSK